MTASGLKVQHKGHHPNNHHQYQQEINKTEEESALSQPSVLGCQGNLDTVESKEFSPGQGLSRTQ